MKLRIATALLAGILVYPAPAVAQLGMPDLSGVSVRLTPHAGLLTPAGWFYAVTTVYGEGPMEWTEAALLETRVVGATAEARFAGTGLWIRGSVQRTLDSDLYVAYAVMNSGPFMPATVLRWRYWLPTSVTMATLDLVFPTQLRLPLGIQPYVTAGIGGKSYTFDRSPLAENGRAVPPEAGTELMASVGGGVVIPIWRRLELDLQARDAISDYWDLLQHDVSWTAGISWRLF